MHAVRSVQVRHVVVLFVETQGNGTVLRSSSIKRAEVHCDCISSAYLHAALRYLLLSLCYCCRCILFSAAVWITAVHGAAKQDKAHSVSRALPAGTV